MGLLSLAPAPARAAAPGAIDVTCDVDRTLFRSAARLLTSSTNVTFRLWTDQTPGAPDIQVGTDYTVPLSALAVFKRHTDRYDGVRPRRTARIDAAIGSDGSPVLLPLDGIAWMDLTVGSTTLGCDHATTGSATSRRRLQSVAFARESIHSETCEACTGTTDVSARVFNSIVSNVPSPALDISIPNDAETAITFASELWDTDDIHSTTVNSSRLTATTAGKYLIFGHAQFEANSTGLRELSILLTCAACSPGARRIAFQRTEATPIPNVSFVSVATHYSLAAGDFVELRANQTSGGPLKVIANFDNGSPEFGMVKLP